MQDPVACRQSDQPTVWECGTFDWVEHVFTSGIYELRTTSGDCWVATRRNAKPVHGCVGSGRTGRAVDWPD
jgi:hypothetical protein